VDPRGLAVAGNLSDPASQVGVEIEVGHAVVGGGDTRLGKKKYE
jgi:hypothetical protein